MQKYLTKIGEAIWNRIEIVNKTVLGAAAVAIAVLIGALLLVIIL
jgi:phosphomevalonate kinase|tara:strand:+ start:452 stop:586 length:135 start_codon:yes stop_codon:yes gene_type:complete